MQLQSWVGIFAQNHTERRAIAGPRASNGLCDDEAVPLICPTCQVLTPQSVLAGDRLLLCMGLFSIFLVGSQNDAARPRESCLKPHTPACPVLYRNGALGEIRTPDPRNRNPMLYPAELRARTAPIIRLGLMVPACASEAGVAPAVLTDIGSAALVAAVGRRAVVIGEGAGGEARAVIMQVADLVGQRIGAVIAVVMPCFGQARGDGREDGCGGEELHSGHHDSPVSLLKNQDFLAGLGP